MLSAYEPSLLFAILTWPPTDSQGNIASWLKKVGDKISPGDAIAELETDKVR